MRFSFPHPRNVSNETELPFCTAVELEDITLKLRKSWLAAIHFEIFSQYHLNVIGLKRSTQEITTLQNNVILLVLFSRHSVMYTVGRNF